jgi:hypothetical protein
LTLWLMLVLAAEPRAVLVGQVRSRGTREPLAVATVSSDDGATAETDADGRFRLDVAAGKRHIRVGASGYQPRDFDEELSDGVELEVRYALNPRAIRPFETVVRGEHERTELGRVSLSGAELHDVAGTGGDPFKVMMLMPGVASPVSGLGYPVVRGSAPAATGYFLDGVRIPQLFHVFLGPAVINADLVDSIDFYSGGAPLQYGRLLGGAIDGHIAKPREGFHAEAQADFINAGALVEAVIPKTGTSVTLAGRLSYSNWIFGLAAKALSANRVLVADFWDYQGRIEQPLLGGALRVFALGSSDTFGDKVPNPDMRSEGTQRVTFHRVDVRYRHSLFKGELEAGASAGVDDLGIASEGPLAEYSFPPVAGTSSQQTVIRQVVGTGRLRWSGALAKHFSASFGATVDRMIATEHQEVTNAETMGPTTSASRDAPLGLGTFWGAWADLTWRPVEQLSATAGVRADYYFLSPNITQASGDPRLSVAWKENDSLTLRASAGMYHQPPTFVISLPVIDLASVKAGLQEVWQLSGGLTWKIWNDLELSADAYFNPMGRVAEVGFLDDEGKSVTPNPTKPQAPSAASVTVTTGNAYGVDLMLRWPLKRHFFGWVTLSVQRSTRLRTFSTMPDVLGAPMATQDLPYAFDQTLIANAVASYRFDSGWTAGVVLHFNTGRPESGEFGSRTKVPETFDFGTITFQEWQRVARNNVDRLPPYFRLDVRVSKTWLTDLFSVEAYLDVLNVTVQQEVIGYDYTGGGLMPLVKTANTVPIIVPSLGLKARY